VFERVEYSYARRRAAQALHRCDPDFPEAFGRECLWDCEAETRSLGTMVAPESQVVRRRLDDLGRDEHEDSDVRAAALVRLEALAESALDIMTAEAEDLGLYE